VLISQSTEIVIAFKATSGLGAEKGMRNIDSTNHCGIISNLAKYFLTSYYVNRRDRSRANEANDL